ncbi:MAG: hypothetical protein NTY37_01475 [Methanothrix sp.]|nr:hypothetical protein [Methanothrix sp.]
MNGSLMAYQGLWAGLSFHDILGWDKAPHGLVLTFIGIGMIFGGFLVVSFAQIKEPSEAAHRLASSMPGDGSARGRSCELIR